MISNARILQIIAYSCRNFSGGYISDRFSQNKVLRGELNRIILYYNTNEKNKGIARILDNER